MLMLIKVIIPSVSVHVWIKNGTCDILFYSNSTRISIKKNHYVFFLSENLIANTLKMAVNVSDKLSCQWCLIQVNYRFLYNYF